MSYASINLISRDVQSILFEALTSSPNSVTIDSVDDIERALAEAASGGRTRGVSVDILGHSTHDHQLLRVGSTVIDMLDAVSYRTFDRIARSGVLRAIEARSLRLLGCATAVSPSGRRTLRMLSRVLGLPVYGAVKRLGKTHYRSDGFAPVFERVLIEASQLSAQRRLVPQSVDFP